MKIDWSKYKEVVANTASTEMEHIIHHMVRGYLDSQATAIQIEELKSLGILVSTEEEKKVEKPFSFLNNDRPQNYQN